MYKNRSPNDLKIFSSLLNKFFVKKVPNQIKQRLKIDVQVIPTANIHILSQELSNGQTIKLSNFIKSTNNLPVHVSGCDYNLTLAIPAHLFAKTPSATRNCRNAWRHLPGPFLTRPDTRFLRDTLPQIIPGFPVTGGQHWFGVLPVFGWTGVGTTGVLEQHAIVAVDQCCRNHFALCRGRGL